jgi:hypothetical protein
MNSDESLRRFFSRHRASTVGVYPEQPEVEALSEEEDGLIEWDQEVHRDDWKPIVLPEAPAKPEETPQRFIDGCHVGHAVVCLRAPESGWPIPVMLAEVGGVAMRLKGRELVRDFFGLERVLSFVVDPFPWDEVEGFAEAMANHSELPMRLLPASAPSQEKNPFDYEVMRKQAQNRSNNEMANWEAIALATDTVAPVLVDGRLEPRLRSEEQARKRPLVIGVVKQQAQNYLHPQGWRTLLDLRPGQRTPYFRIARRKEGGENDLPVATWYLKLAGTHEQLPNWGAVRVEIAWVQFERWPESARTSMVNRLSRWLIDARCRQRSYVRAPVSLEPIVRAEESLRSLFAPFSVLRNRFYRHAGVLGGSSS